MRELTITRLRKKLHKDSNSDSGGLSDNPEMARLEILEKRVEVQGKLISNQREKLELENRKKYDQRKKEEHQILMDKISQLQYLLGDFTVDEERTTMGGEPFLCRVLDKEERAIVSHKLMDLILKL